MEVIYENCAGLDVHKKEVVCCALYVDEKGKKQKEVKSFGTVTREIERMSRWLGDKGVTHVAMESTGVYWKPLFNILENNFEVVLVNAKKIKHVPGRKTDVKDAEWIAQLLQAGLLQGSFVPDLLQRELRDLTRHRAQLTSEETRVANRIQKILEDANIKIGSVASEILGVSGRLIIQAIIEGEKNPGEMANMSRGRLRSKRDEMEDALEGHVTEHHRFILKILIDHLEALEKMILELDSRMEDILDPFQEQIGNLMTIPGVKKEVSHCIIAEIGVNMNQFPTEAHLASWTGLCPGNNRSAGRSRGAKITYGNRWLRRSLSQAAWGATRKKDSFLSSQYHRLSSRRGKKRALIAIAHSLLTIIFHILKKNTQYKELGADFYDKIQPARLKKYYVKRLEKLGYSVSLNTRDIAA